MWKAVIADDEGVILQGLKKLVDWTNMDVHLVGGSTGWTTVERSNGRNGS